MDDNNEGLILLPTFRFPDHWQIQVWLNGTKYDKQFTLVIAQVEVDNSRRRPNKSMLMRTVAALEPKTKNLKFLWTLKGEPGAKELEQKILDFNKK